ncbi:MAG: hypothetical protein R2827_12730 [Bdellovibrionales bacterium]
MTTLDTSALGRPNKAPNLTNLTVGKRMADMPDGRYKARITEINERQFFKGKRSLEFCFEIVEGEYHGVTLRGFMNAHYEVLYLIHKAVQMVCCRCRVRTRGRRISRFK